MRLLVPASTNRLRRLVADRRGAAALEFAMTAAALISLMLASIETSLVFFVQGVLQTSVEKAARTIITGQTQSNDSSGASSGMSAAQLQARFKQAACNSLPGFLSCAKLYVDVRSSTDWASMDTSTPQIQLDANGNVANNFSYNVGNSGSIVLVRLIYLWPVSTGPLGFKISDVAPGKRLIVATSVAKVENYTSS